MTFIQQRFIKLIKSDSEILNQHIRVISEDHVTEDWRYDAENAALNTGINYILKYIQIEKSYLKL